jgi:hypothetical protein
MTERSLQVTYRKGRAFAAYLHLSHLTGEKSVKTVPSHHGLLVVDYGATARRVGVEWSQASVRAASRSWAVAAERREDAGFGQRYEPAVEANCSAVLIISPYQALQTRHDFYLRIGRLIEERTDCRELGIP